MLLALLAGCAKAPAPAPEQVAAARGAAPTQSQSQQRLSELRSFEAGLRQTLVPEQQAPWLDSGGADPYRLAKLPGAGGYVGILRGARALVVLDPDLNERSRFPLEEAPTALCLSQSNEALVASRYSGEILRLRVGTTQTHELQRYALAGRGVADLACGERGLVYALEADGSSLFTLDRQGRILDERRVMRGGLRLLRRARYLLLSSLFERSLCVLQLDEQAVPARELGCVRHDGPIWAFDAVEQASGLLLAVAGVEDRPLVRAHGEFENIDSFVWLYRLRSTLEQLAALNVGEHGLVVPKSVQLGVNADGVRLTALASGSARLLRAVWPPDFKEPPQVSSEPAPPGASDALFEPERVVFASPLFDAWVRWDTSGARFTQVDPKTRPPLSARLGEALFFTELMAPENPSSGSHSRFSCETCHLEGGVDGRVHYTGRADVRVVTKPLFGLANNRPHFSRALDPDLSAVSHHEFRVAGAGSGKDPWFTLAVADFPWLRELGIREATLTPDELRRALISFFYRFSHAPNPQGRGRSAFSALESQGAKAFRDRCSSCHAARLFSDEPSSEVTFERWEALVLARNAPIVWARGDYETSGILPYVHELGTRIPSLRRLHLKPRFFTNGSSPTLEDVLLRFRFSATLAKHDEPGASVPALDGLDEATRKALLAFLVLL